MTASQPEGASTTSSSSSIRNGAVVGPRRRARRRSGRCWGARDDADARVGERLQVGGRAIAGRVVPDHDLARGVGRAQQDVLDAAAQQVHAVVREDDDRDAVAGAHLRPAQRRAEAPPEVSEAGAVAQGVADRQHGRDDAAEVARAQRVPQREMPPDGDRPAGEHLERVPAGERPLVEDVVADEVVGRLAGCAPRACRPPRGALSIRRPGRGRTLAGAPARRSRAPRSSGSSAPPGRRSARTHGRAYCQWANRQRGSRRAAAGSPQSSTVHAGRIPSGDTAYEWKHRFVQENARYPPLC